MAFCTKCGAVHHDDDTHVCDTGDVPKKGEVYKTLKEKVVKVAEN